MDRRFILVFALALPSTLACTLVGCDCAGPPVATCQSSTECTGGLVCVDHRCGVPPDGALPDSGGHDAARPDSPFPDTGPAPRCGDGTLRSGEACDDGNTMDGDGCSSMCLVEAGYSCPAAGSPCVSTIVCGDGALGGTEGCDDHNTTAGDGCSATCTLEPGWTCMTVGLPCTATACGDGIIAGNEECEDGGMPPVDGDGCSHLCLFEEGYACPTAGSPCMHVTCGNGVREGTEQCDDGNHDLGDGCDTLCHREPMCTNGVCVAVCGDNVLLPGEQCDDGNTRDGDGCSSTCMMEMGFTCTASGGAEPTSVSIPIVYRDFRGNDLTGGHPDFENANGGETGIVMTMLDAQHKPAYNGMPTTATTHGESWFHMWYRDTTDYNIPLASVLTLDRTAPATYVFDDGTFFPLDGLGWVALGTEPARNGGHNFSFTSELRYWFTYAGTEVLTFRGDDDVWVFINGRLALDLGGVHGAEDGTVTLSASATTLGLNVGGIYEACVFQAERHTSASSYRLTLAGFNAQHSTCVSHCGDGIVTRDEICDDMVDDGSYGHCTADCLGYGPRCGDAMVQMDQGEQCDDGTNTGGYDHCAPGCQLGPRCGDHIVQSGNGEECDDGNTTPGDGCDATCQTEIR